MVLRVVFLNGLAIPKNNGFPLWLDPATCSEAKKCSPTASDGEFWLYPRKFNRQIPVKSYCHNMFSPETAEEFITLQNTNYFIRKDFCHLDNGDWCTRSSKPLRRTEFSKVKIDITVREKSEFYSLIHVYLNRNSCF